MIAGHRTFENANRLAEGLAKDVANWLNAALAAKGHATIAVSGGNTPKPFFVKLAAQNLDWKNITITLVDERMVPEDHPRSNARLVRDNLLQAEAAKAQFVPLYLNPDLVKLPVFDVVILGMGNDGHTASFFPNGNNLAAAIATNATAAVLPMTAPGAGEERLTFTLPRLLAATHLCLHIQGQDKLQVLEKAIGGNDAKEMPVRAVLNAAKPFDVYWCP